MKTWIRRIVLALLFAAPVPAVAQSAPPAFSIHILPVQSVVRAGSHLSVEIVFTIITTIPWTQRRGQGSELEYSVDVRNTNGDLLPKSNDLKVSEGTDTGGLRTIWLDPHRHEPLDVRPEPGATFSEDLDVSNLYDLSRPGNYTIQVSRIDPKTKAEVKSNTITVTAEEPSEYDQRFAQAGAPFLLAITIPEDTVKSGSDVPLRMYTTNLTGHELAFDCAKYDEQVYDAEGTPLPWIGGPGLRRVIETGNGRACGIGPYGTEERLAAHLDKLYDLSKPGKYTIQASRFDDETKTWVKSSTITLTVTP